MIQWEIVRHQVAIAGTVSDSQTNRTIGGARVAIRDAPEAFVDRLITWARSVKLAEAAPSSVHAARAKLESPASTTSDKVHASQTVLDYLRRKSTIGFERPDFTHTTANGHFHFLDLPNGDYQLVASLPGAGTRYGVKVSSNLRVTSEGIGEDRDIAMQETDLRLSPTTVKGEIMGITNGETEAVSLARVHVAGSGERTLSDGAGKYLLTELEAPSRNTPEEEAADNRVLTIHVSAPGFNDDSQKVELSRAGDVKEGVDFILRAIRESG